VDLTVHDDGVDVHHLRRPLVWYAEVFVIALGMATLIAGAVLAICAGLY
jgi:hypothetical protein